MITCKEDLKGFYALRSDKEVFELFMDKCEEFGITWADGHLPRGVKGGEAVSVVFSVTSCDCLGFGSELFYKNLDRKAITLVDFNEVSKPIDDAKGIASKWKYVPVVGVSIFDLQEDLKAGNLYFQDHNQGNSDGMVQIENEIVLIELLATQNIICSKVEVKWQDEVEEYLLTCNAVCGMFDIQYGNGNQLALADEDFLEAARIALKATGELK